MTQASPVVNTIYPWNVDHYLLICGPLMREKAMGTISRLVAEHPHLGQKYWIKIDAGLQDGLWALEGPYDHRPLPFDPWLIEVK